ncbi:hypothetical protein ABTX62_29235 [Streptomyces sp. NPDC096046]
MVSRYGFLYCTFSLVAGNACCSHCGASATDCCSSPKYCSV